MALHERKLLYMAVPKLAEAKPFYLLDPDMLPVTPERAAVKDVVARVANPVGLDEMRPVDLVVCGSVAVNRRGVRLGKGAGYTDIELALLHETGLIGPKTVIVTTVHSLQVVDDQLPEAEYDFGVDIILTPEETIYCSAPSKPSGLLWKHLTRAKIASIPILGARQPVL
jgi:5-formyltetrahydrofolate cyclo-ligase